jgi:phosphatidylserine decarboxylase
LLYFGRSISPDARHGILEIEVESDIVSAERIGMFHFGDSTHTLIFRPEVKLDFDPRGQTPGLESKNISVRAPIARLK